MIVFGLREDIGEGGDRESAGEDGVCLCVSRVDEGSAFGVFVRSEMGLCDVTLAICGDEITAAGLRSWA